MPSSMEQIKALRPMVKGVYDLQQLRMQTGLRMCANFRAKLKLKEGEEEVDPENPDELSKEAEALIDRLKVSFRRLTDGIAKNQTLPKREGFVGDELISTFPEAVLVSQYIELEKQESKNFRQLEGVLLDIPIYRDWLSRQTGVGPAMAGAILSKVDPYKARHASSVWKYAGLDTAPDGRGRSRRKEHLVERTYKDRDGQERTRLGVTYDPWLKTKLFVLAGSFMRSGSEWRNVYDGMRHRLMTDPGRVKATSAEYKKVHARNPEEARDLWTPLRIDMASKRYMLKMFLLALWREWRTMEGLPIDRSYTEEMHRQPPHGGDAGYQGWRNLIPPSEPRSESHPRD